MSEPSVAVVPVNYDSIPQIHQKCAQSTFWEIDPLSEKLASLNPTVDKEAWIAGQSFDHGTCGFNIVLRDSEKRAFATVLFCPSSEAPGAIRMPSGSLSRDAYAITSLHIDSVAAGRGWESVLLDASIMALNDRGVPALEAFGYDPEAPKAESDFNQALVDHASEIGLMDKTMLESAGFRVVHDHPVIPRLRLDLPPEQDLLSAAQIEDLLQSVPAIS
ncbi:hypothetical protein ACXZ66_13895 [Corynebacterium sp. S7]